MIDRNFLKEKIGRGLPVIGTWNTLASPLTSEVFAHAGFDFLIVDFEHGPFQLDRVHDYVSRCERYECSPIVRVPARADWMILQSLDQGAHGVVVPHIENRSSAEELVTFAKYRPIGNRGFTPYSKAGGFTNIQARTYPSKANEFGVITIIVESKEGLEHLDEILQVDAVDIVYFGAYDLSQAFGVPGETRHEKVVNAVARAVQKVNAAGKCAGGFVPESRDDVKWLLDLGIRFITFSVDSSLIFRPIRDLVDWFEDETKRER